VTIEYSNRDWQAFGEDREFRIKEMMREFSERNDARSRADYLESGRQRSVADSPIAQEKLAAPASASRNRPAIWRWLAG